MLIERYASSRKRQSWQDSHLSGRYGASNSTFLTAYWNQDESDSSQELVVLFQKKDLENSITQARFTSNNVTENDWVADVLGFSHPRGSTFAMALAGYGSGKHFMLYNVDVNKTLQQHDYTINDASVTSGSAVSTKTESGQKEAHHLVEASQLLTRYPRYRSPRGTAIAFSSHCSRQSGSLYKGHEASMHQEDSIDQPNPLRLTQPHISTSDRMELYCGVYGSNFRHSTHAEAKYNLSCAVSAER